MPQELSDFPLEVQVAFFVYSLLEDNWEGMSGSFLGKIWSSVEFYFNTYEVNNRREVIFFMKTIENITINHRAEEQAKKAKERERKAPSGGGKNYAHNVKR